MFGLSGSSSRSRSSGQSTSSSSSFGESASQQGSVSDSISGGTSLSQNQAQSRQGIAFEDVFARLFQRAETDAAGLDPSILTDASNQLFAGGVDFLGSIGGDAGSAFLEERLAGAGALEQEQIDQLQADIGELFSEELLPGITSEAVAGGQLGGGRQGVAQGAAAEAATEAFSSGAVDIRQRSQAQLDAIASGVADRGLQGAQIGLAGSPMLAGLAEMGFSADLRGSELLASILGGPTTLTQSESTGFSSAEDFARAFSESFGRAASRDQSRSASQSTTSSKSDSTSAGISF